ncbi:MAG: hypothetical protein SGPRY_003455, partial [Prymnesium sp.]
MQMVDDRSKGRTSSEVSVICTSSPPFKICWASQGFLDLFGFTRNEALMRDLRCIQGSSTDLAAARAISRSVKAQVPLSFTCINCTRSGEQ